MTTKPFNRLLVALDGSRLAEEILPTAAGIAHRCGGELVLLHVLEAAPPEAIHGEPHLTTAEAAAGYLEAVAADLRQAGIICRVAVVAADHAAVASCIARQARAFEADVIALTTHGSGGLRGFLFGRIAQQVLQEAERPTLVTRAGQRRSALLRVPSPPQRLLVPLGGTPASEQVFPLAWELARCLAAQVTLVRVVPTLERLSLAESTSAVFLPTATAALLDLERQHAAEDLQRLAASAPTGLTVTTVVHQGDVIEELTRLAQQSDLIVMTTHGRAGLSGWLAGSVAARLLERIPIPLLLVPVRGLEESAS